MASSRANFYLNSSNYYDKMVKFVCGRTGMKAYLCSTDAQIGSGSMNVTGTFTWSNANLILEPYHSNNGYMNWYLIRIYEGDNKIMELYPAQKPDYGWCFKDNISGNYFYNSDAAPWVYTESNESIEIE